MSVKRARVGCGALLAATWLTLGSGIAAGGRYEELKRVIDRNTGFAHMTRGMNMYTLVALRSCVTERDVPVLTAMLADRDHVTQLSAANVLADLGEDGHRALRRALAAAPDVQTRSVIEDVLRESAAPGRRPIKDYPLTDRERARIRGC